MDAMIIVNEAKDSILKRGVILCKLDIEKAYDNAEWSFLLAVMENMGFGGEVAKVVLSSFGVVWVFPNSVRNLLLEWSQQFMGVDYLSFMNVLDV